MQHPTLSACLIALLVFTGPNLVGQDDKTEWGHLTATFLYDGEPPKPKELVIDKDIGAFELPLFDQSLLVDAKTKGLANVVVWLYVAPKAKLPPIHPSYAELAKRDVALTYRNGEFDPHISLVWISQNLVQVNSDKVGYNPKADLFQNSSWGDLIPAQGTLRRTFTRSESRPMPLACSIHSWMSGYILIKDHPYCAKSNSEGKLQIKNLPVGAHTFHIWHESRGFITDAKLNGEQTKWTYGRLTTDIKPGDNDIGKVELAPDRRE